MISFALDVVNKLGNNDCVASGANPHSMVYVVRNDSNEDLELTSRRCPESCQQRHLGFGAMHGKFKEGFTPKQVLKAHSKHYVWMSGRAGSAVNPDCWIEYNTKDNKAVVLKLLCKGAGWTDLQNRAEIKASFKGDTTLNVSVQVDETVAQQMRSNNIAVKEIDNHRQFAIVISSTGRNRKEAKAGQEVQDRVLPVLDRVALGAINPLLPVVGGAVDAAAREIQSKARQIAFDQAKEVTISTIKGLIKTNVVPATLGLILLLMLGLSLCKITFVLSSFLYYMINYKDKFIQIKVNEIVSQELPKQPAVKKLGIEFRPMDYEPQVQAGALEGVRYCMEHAMYLFVGICVLDLLGVTN
jgi:hypothetical protein